MMVEEDVVDNADLEILVVIGRDVVVVVAVVDEEMQSPRSKTAIRIGEPVVLDDDDDDDNNPCNIPMADVPPPTIM